MAYSVAPCIVCALGLQALWVKDTSGCSRMQQLAPAHEAVPFQRGMPYVEALHITVTASMLFALQGAAGPEGPPRQQLLGSYQPRLTMLTRHERGMLQCNRLYRLQHAHRVCVLQELWAKKAPPSQQLVGSYRPQPKIPSECQETPPRPDPEAEVKLVEAADALGALLLYRHQGFVSNCRQQRAGGLGAIELAQTLRALVSPSVSWGHELLNAQSTGQLLLLTKGWGRVMPCKAMHACLQEPASHLSPVKPATSCAACPGACATSLPGVPALANTVAADGPIGARPWMSCFECYEWLCW